MSLVISYILTIIAVVTASITIIWLFWRDWKKNKKPTARDIPCEGTKWCKCYWCELDRIINDE